jgi:hypothetical protein
MKPTVQCKKERRELETPTGGFTIERVSGHHDELGSGFELWDKTSPQLERALSFYDRLSSESLPETAWLGKPSKEKYKKEIDAIIDVVLDVLGTCVAVDIREEIKSLQEGIDEAQQLVGEYRELSLTAPPKSSLSLPNALWTKSKEGCIQAITEHLATVEQMRQQITEIKGRFRAQLQEMGIEVAEDDVDELLLPITQDDIVTMSAVIRNVAGITEQLERLIEASMELPSQTRRYYGVYLLLVYAIAFVQARYVREIEHVHIPKLHKFEEEARKNIAEAQTQILRGGPREQLKANIDASKTTIQACQCLATALVEQKSVVARENEKTQRMYAAAVNTYRTVRLSLNVAGLIRDCQKAFQALRQLHVPSMRPFQNLQLKEEMQHLAERMIREET